MRFCEKAMRVYVVGSIWFGSDFSRLFLQECDHVRTEELASGDKVSSG